MTSTSHTGAGKSRARAIRHAPVAFAMAVVASIGGGSPASSQGNPRPIIESGSERLQIVDGGDRLVGILSREVDPDTYIVHPSDKPKVVSYITDRGRLDLKVSPGGQYDFAIRYQGRLYNQRVATVDPNAPRYQGAAERPGGVDVVPFKLGANNAIHFIGSINGSPPLDLIFDTGAALGVHNEGSAAKGARFLPGRANSIAFGTVRVDGLPLVRIDYRGTARNEGVVGFDAFAGKVVAIDYDRQLLRVMHDLPDTRGFVRVPIVWRELNTTVAMTVATPMGAKEVLAIFDTGSRFSLSVGSSDPAAPAIRSLASIGTRTGSKVDGTKVAADVVTLPWAAIGGLRLNDVQADVERSGASNLGLNIVGNDFLKRFNVVIDYRSSTIYLKPNHLVDAPYNSVFPLRLITWLAAVAAVLAAVAGLFIWRRRRTAQA